MGRDETERAVKIAANGPRRERQRAGDLIRREIRPCLRQHHVQLTRSASGGARDEPGLRGGVRVGQILSATKILMLALDRQPGLVIGLHLHGTSMQIEFCPREGRRLNYLQQYVAARMLSWWRKPSSSIAAAKEVGHHQL